VFEKMEQLPEQKFLFLKCPQTVEELDIMASDYTQKIKSDQVSWKVLLTK
jgi:hypothetical protein